MASKTFRRILIDGLALAIPLGILIFVFIKIHQILMKIADPLAKKLQIELLFGGLTVAILAVVLFFLIVIFLGLLMFIPAVVRTRAKVEQVILYIIPSLNQLKVIAGEKLTGEDSASAWKSILLKQNEDYTPAIITEEVGEWVTIVLIRAPRGEPEDIIIAKKANIEFIEFPMMELAIFARKYGRGFSKYIKKGGEATKVNG